VIGVLGGGQLGRMLALAGTRLGERFCFLDPAPDAPAAEMGRHIVAAYDDSSALDELAAAVDVVTFEFENVPARAVRSLHETTTVHPSPLALEVSQHRLEEKRWFEKLGIPTSPFAPAASAAELRTQLGAIGLPAVVKIAAGGYDGKGQAVVRDLGDADGVWESLSGPQLLVEALVPFERELSIIAVRDARGARVFYPLVENHHADGILRMSLAPAPDLSAGIQSEAEEIATALLDALDYFGVLASELFQTSGGLLANEMAPRVHNSGHYSIDASVCSQFENHIRAIRDLPLGSTAPTGRAVMFNLISQVPELSSVLAVPGARLHLYGKSPRPGRKLGHITLRDPAPDEIERVRDLVDYPLAMQNSLPSGP
jgi:5-(carboxyamino)imidazole ribonucleotide synthase